MDNQININGVRVQHNKQIHEIPENLELSIFSGPQLNRIWYYKVQNYNKAMGK